MRITISRWFTPDHNSVAPDGVQPDIAAAPTAETPPGDDPALQAALDFLADEPVAGDPGATEPSGATATATAETVVGVVALRPIC